MTVDARPTSSTLAPPGDAGESVVTLERGDAVVLVRLASDELPTIVHWGPRVGSEGETGALLAALAMPAGDSIVTTQERVSVLPQHSRGWLGRPGLLGHRQGRDWSVAFDRVTHSLRTTDTPGRESGCVRLTSEAVDTPGGLVVSTEIELLDTGVLRVRASVLNTGPTPFEVTHLEPALPVPPTATELLDFTGRHTHERHPQRRPFDVGAWVRESWGGRPGHDAATLLCAGTPAFGYRRGRGVGGPRRLGRQPGAVRRAVGHRLAPAARG